MDVSYSRSVPEFERGRASCRQNITATLLNLVVLRIVFSYSKSSIFASCARSRFLQDSAQLTAFHGQLK